MHAEARASHGVASDGGVVADLLEVGADAAASRLAAPRLPEHRVERLLPCVRVAEACDRPREHELQALELGRGSRRGEQEVRVGPRVRDLLEVAAGLEDGDGRWRGRDAAREDLLSQRGKPV